MVAIIFLLCYFYRWPFLQAFSNFFVFLQVYKMVPQFLILPIIILFLLIYEYREIVCSLFYLLIDF